MARFLVSMFQLGALGVYLAIGYLYVVSGLAVPAAFLVPLWGAWTAILIIGVSHRDDMRYVASAPLAAAILWGAIVLGLGSLLNWKA